MTLFGGLYWKAQTDDLVLDAGGEWVTRVTKHPEHAAIVRLGFGDEVRDAVWSRGAREVPEKKDPDAVVLVMICDEERDLGVSGLGDSVVAADSDQFLTVFDDVGETVDVVDRGEVFDFLGRNSGCTAK